MPIPVAVPIVRAAWPAKVAAGSLTPPMVLAVGSTKTRIARQRRPPRPSAFGLLAVGAGLTVLIVALAYSAWSAKDALAGRWNRQPSNPTVMASAALPQVPPPDAVAFVAENELFAPDDKLETPLAPPTAANADAGINAASPDRAGPYVEFQDTLGGASGNQSFTADAWVAQLADRGTQDLDQPPFEPSATLPAIPWTTLRELANHPSIQSQVESRLPGIRKRAGAGQAQVSDPVATEDLGIFSRPPASFDYRRRVAIEDDTRPVAPGS